MRIRGIALATICQICLSMASHATPGTAPKQEPVSISGLFVVLRGDPPPEEKPAPGSGYRLYDEEGKPRDLLVDGGLLATAGGALALDRRMVNVTGVFDAKNGDAIVVETIGFALPEDAKAAAEGITPRIAGAQKWLTILCRFSDATNVTPHPAGWFDTLMGSSFPGMDHFWRRLSYNNIDLSGSVVTGWHNLPHPRSWYLGGGPVPQLDLQAAADDCSAAADAAVYFPDFAGINFMFNQTLDCCSWGGAVVLSRDGQTKSYGAAWMPPWGYDNQSTLAREMGRALGLPHSSGPYESTYDSRWDPLSAGGMCRAPDPVYGCLGDHTIAYHKDRLGWIPAASRYTAAAGTTQTIVLTPIGDPPAGGALYSLAKIPIAGSATQFYTVEARRFLNTYDAEIPGEGILIHRVDTTRSDRLARVVDADNDGDPSDEGATFSPGETFSDPGNGIRVTVGTTPSSAGIPVTIALQGSGTICPASTTLSVPEETATLAAPLTTTSPAAETGRWTRQRRPGGETWTYTFTVRDGPAAGDAALGTEPLAAAAIAGGFISGGGAGWASPPDAGALADPGALATLDAGATRAFLRSATGGGGVEVSSPSAGQTVWFHLDWQMTGTGGPVNVTQRAVLDGNVFCAFSTSAFPSGWLSWCADPWTVAAGTHTLRWDLDYLDTVPEISESNNSAGRSWPATLDLAAQRAYLMTAGGGGIENLSPLTGETVFFHLDWQLAGTGGPVDATHRALIDGFPFCEFTVPVGPATWTAWCGSGWVAAPGTHTLRWDLDYLDAIPETNEANNSASRGWSSTGIDIEALGGYLRTAPGGGGDRNSSPMAGQTAWLNFDWRVANLGSPITVNERAFLDGVRVCGCGRTVPAGDSTWVSSTCAPGWTVGPGAHTLRWELDYTNSIAELNETNNHSVAALAVPTPVDNCSDGAVIAATPRTETTVTDTATTEPADPAPPCGNESRARSVWYKFTAPGTGVITADTLTSDYDTILSVWTGSCGAFTPLSGGCSDDVSWPNNIQSQVSFQAIGGTTYYFMITDYRGSGGRLFFHLSFQAAVPSNDDCANAETVPPASSSTAQYTALATTAASDPAPSCGNASRARSVWYSFTAPGDGTMRISANDSYATILSAWTGSCGAPVAVPGACASGSAGVPLTLQFPAAAGTTYRIMASATNNDGGSLSLGFDFAQQAGSIPDGGRTGEIPFSLETTPAGTLLMAWSPSCRTTDTDYAVYRGTLGDFTSHVPVICSTGGSTMAEIDASGGDAYYLIVARNASREGSYGADSRGVQRPPSAAACLPQMIGTCPSGCGHSKCETGGALSPACDSCVAAICAGHPSCCSTGWDATCVNEVRTVCGILSCPSSAGVCAHTVCSGGAPLVSGCDNPPVSPSCAAAVCAQDADCCDTSWGLRCVSEVPLYCGLSCD